MAVCLADSVLNKIMKDIQQTLCICDEEPAANAQIVSFLKKMGEIMFQMQVSDPPLIFDLSRIGEKI